MTSGTLNPQRSWRGETLSPNLALSINAELRETGIVLLSIAQPDAFLQQLHLTGRLYPNAKLHRAQVAARKVHDFIDAANYQLEEIAWQSPRGRKVSL